MSSPLYKAGYFQNYISFLDAPHHSTRPSRAEKCALIQKKFSGLKDQIENSLPKDVSKDELFQSLCTHKHAILGTLFLGDYDAFREAAIDGEEYFDIIIKLNQHSFDNAYQKEWYVCLKPETKLLDLGVDDGVNDWISLVNKASGCFIAPIGDEREWFLDTFDLIDDSLLNDKKILINCSYGVSRSSTLVLAYLINRFEVSLEQALAYVKNIRHQVNPNQGFYTGLNDYARKINGVKKSNT